MTPTDAATPLPVHLAEAVPPRRSHATLATVIHTLPVRSAEAVIVHHAVISAEATALLPAHSAVAEASHVAMAEATILPVATAIQTEAVISADADKNDILLFFAHNSLQI